MARGGVDKKKSPSQSKGEVCRPKLTKTRGLIHERSRCKQFRTCQLALSIPCGICAEIQTDGDLWEDKGRHRDYTAEAMPAKGIEIIEAQACPDHIHMLISIPPKYSVSRIMGYLKGKRSLMIFDRHANLKYKYGNRHFWARGYFMDTVGRNKKAIKAYIQNQLEEDEMSDQISIKEFIDPFTGSKNPKAQIKTP